MQVPAEDIGYQATKTAEVEELASELSYMKAMDGFVMVVSQQGDIVYCSENISEHLGVSQVILSPL